ncbi:MAG: SoxR reducing system RseC family protein [Clostridiales bacterium]|nr:SoxR reducing system RseC family protein [Clostridiales bacterium]
MERIELGEVTASKKSISYVKITKNEACEGCKACAFGRKNVLVLPAQSLVPCSKGDKVKIRMPSEQVKGAYLYVYLLPLLFLFAGLMIGLPLGEKVMYLTAFLCFCGSIPVVYGIERLLRRQKKYLPMIVEIVNENKEQAND